MFARFRCLFIVHMQMGIHIGLVDERAGAQKQHQTLYVKIHLLQMPFLFVILSVWSLSGFFFRCFKPKSIFICNSSIQIFAFVIAEHFLFASLTEINDLHIFNNADNCGDSTAKSHSSVYRTYAGRFNHEKPLSKVCVNHAHTHI